MENVNESSLSRIYKKMEYHDTGTITAFRFAKECGEGDIYSKKENLQRNKSMLAKLQSKRYGVTKVKGSYIENYGTPQAREVGENVFFIEDMNDTGDLLKDLKKFGIEFDQDSILFIPQGGKEAFLHGTNKCESGYPGFGKKIKFSGRQLGKDGEFFTRVNGRPFVFKESKELSLPQGFYGRWGCTSIANQNWKDIKLSEDEL